MKLRKFLILISGFAVVIFLVYSASKSQNVTHGFTSYYTFSRIFLEGGDMSKTYDSTFFYQKIREYGIENVYDQPNNLPTSAFLMLPIAPLNPPSAKVLWTFLSVIFFFISLWLMLRSFDINLKSSLGQLLVSFAFLFYPLYYNISLGQAYLFILMLLSLSVYGFKKNNLWLSSVPLSLVLVLKGYGLIPLIFLAVFKKWKELFAVLALSVLIMLVTLPLLHIEAWQVSYDKVFLVLGRDQYTSFAAYQTLNSLLRHAIDIGSVNYIVITCGFVIIGLVIFKKNNKDFLAYYVTAISLNVILAPVAEEHHYVLFLPLIFILAKLLYENYDSLKTANIFFILSVIILAVPIGYRSFRTTAFPLYLLGYPKLYAGIILIIIAKITLMKGSLSGNLQEK